MSANRRTVWTDSRIDKLKDMRALGSTIQDIADELGTSYASTQQAVLKYCGRIQAPDYTDAEKQHVVDTYATTPTIDIAKHLGRTINSVANQAQKLGLVKAIGDRRRWLDWELEYITQQHQHQTSDQMATVLGRSACAVHNRLVVLGLRKYIKHKRLTQTEDKYLMENYATFTAKELARVLECEPRYIYVRAKQLGLSKNKKRV